MTTFDMKQHMQDRGVVSNYPSLYVDYENNVATFLLYTWTGKLIGFHQYKPLAPKKHAKGLKPNEMKYFPHCLQGSHAYWGADTIDHSKRLVLVTEGVFDAISLHNAGFNCIAALGNNPTALRNMVYTNTQYEFVPVCDGDSAGMLLAKYSSHGRMVVMPYGKDCGDYALMPTVLSDYIHSALRR